MNSELITQLRMFRGEVRLTFDKIHQLETEKEKEILINELKSHGEKIFQVVTNFFYFIYGMEAVDRDIKRYEDAIEPTVSMVNILRHLTFPLLNPNAEEEIKGCLNRQLESLQEVK